MAAIVSSSESGGWRRCLSAGPQRSAFASGLGRGLAGTLGIGIFLICALLGWAWTMGDETRARLAAAVPQVSIPLDWDALVVTAPPSTPNVPAQTPSQDSALAVLPAEKTPDSATPPRAATAPLPPAPIEGTFETSESRRLPVIRATDGLTPFAAYRRPFDIQTTAPSGARGLVSIVIRDMGLSDSATATAIKSFPPDVTFVVSPYATQPDFWQEQARAAGHEVWMHLPTATPGRDAGPLALSGATGLEENGRRILETLGQAVGYAGVVLLDSCGPLGTTSQGETLRGPLFKRGLGLADLSPTPCEALGLAAAKSGISYTAGAERLDRELTAQSIRDALDLLEARAVANGSATGIIFASPLGFREVQAWIETLPHKNIVLAPLSAQAWASGKVTAP